MKFFIPIVGLGLLCPALHHAQVSPIFASLPLHDCASGYLWNTVMPHAFPSDGTDDVTSIQARQWLIDFEQAAVNTNAWLPTLENLEAQCSSEQTMRFAVIEASYDRISEAAMQSGDVFSDGDHISANGNPFELRTASFMHWPNQGYCPIAFDCQLNESLHLHQGPAPSAMQIDFQDGQGWRIFNYNQPEHVHYEDAAEEHLVKLRLFRASGDTQELHFVIKHMTCQSNYAMPQAQTPWPNESAALPWEISTDYLGSTIKGNAYYLPAGDFDKPFLFVEGIDFGTYQGTFQCGDFGWCQLTSGLNHPEYDYSMLSLMPQFMDSLRLRGYDIILLDFKNGKADMRANSALLEELIRRINTYKVGDNSLVVAGASMGGQITRHAIAHMESTGEQPCIRLWISFDSPHTGAYLPLSLQHLLDALSDEALAREARDIKLLSPAARQLTRWLYHDSDNIMVAPDSSHLSWYAELEELGYPKSSRNIAVTNGSLTGTVQLDQHGYVNGNQDPILDYNCDLTPCSVGPEAKFLLMPSNGDPWFVDNWGNQSTPSQTVCTQIVRSELSAESMANSFGYLGVFGFLLSTFCMPEKQVSTYYTPAQFPNWDYAPGGYRNSIGEFIDGVNSTGALQSASCNSIDENTANMLHCFIPTASALGISTDDPYLHLANYMAAHPEACPFDSYFGPFGSNQPHTQLTPENMAYLLLEITGSENPDGTSLLGESLANNQLFNFGFPGCYEVPSLEIFNGSRLMINAHQPFQYQNDFSWMPAWGSNFRMTTKRGCSPSMLHAFNQGTIEIGDANGETTGELRMVNGSAMVLHEGGRLIVHPGSTLIVEDGSEITATIGTQIELRGGKILLREGGRIHASDSEILLIGDDAEIIFEGGQLDVLPESMLHIHSPTAPLGQLRFRDSNPNSIILGHHSILTLEGSDSEDEAIVLEPHSRMGILSYADASELVCAQLKIRFQEESKLEIAAHSNFLHVAFHNPSDNTNNTTFAQYGFSCGMTHCQSYGTVFWGENTRYHADHCHFDENSRISFQEGYYDVRSSVFNHSCISSVSMPYACILRDCEFNGSFEGPMVTDISLNKLLVERCGFYDHEDDAIYKKGGQLSLRCNEFIGVQGITIASAQANLSSQQQAGYNSFADVSYCIQLIDAQGILLNRGYNDFSGARDDVFIGTINQLCNEQTNCIIKIPAHRNLWSLDLTDLGPSETSSAGPNPDMIHVFASSIPSCAGYENTNACAALFLDEEPSFFNPCPTKYDWSWSAKEKSDDNHAWDTLSQITLHTTHFENSTLDSALRTSLSMMSIFNQNGNDSLAIVMLHEILMSDFDWKHPQIRPVMRWAADWMQASFEAFRQNKYTPPSAFDAVTQCYADVLNHLTLDTLESALYREQFYHELKKGQFYLTLGRKEIAHFLFDALVDCSLDSLEREVALFWKGQASTNEFSISGVNIDSLASPNFIGSFVRSQYGFGCVIISPEMFDVIGCLDDVTYRKISTRPDIQLYPNPCDGSFTLENLRWEEDVVISIHNAQGRLLNQQLRPTNALGNVVVTLPSDFASGLYFISVQDSAGLHQTRFVTR